MTIFFTLRPSAAQLIFSSEFKDTKRANLERPKFFFEVHPLEHDYLELETGEIFAREDYARVHLSRMQLISASLLITEAHTEEEISYSRMAYLEGSKRDDGEGYDPSISFHLFLPPAHFQQLMTNARSGLLPSSITLTLPYDFHSKENPLKMGWEPDGSGTKWNNRGEEDRKISIEGATLSYDLLTVQRDTETGEVAQPRPVSEIGEAINDELHSIQRLIAKAGQAVIWIGGVLVLLAIYYVSRR
jgi:hypothetical protein